MLCFDTMKKGWNVKRRSKCSLHQDLGLIWPIGNWENLEPLNMWKSLGSWWINIFWITPASLAEFVIKEILFFNGFINEILDIYRILTFPFFPIFKCPSNWNRREMYRNGIWEYTKMKKESKKKLLGWLFFAKLQNTGIWCFFFFFPGKYSHPHTNTLNHQHSKIGIWCFLSY